jgi:hypothetical protein
MPSLDSWGALSYVAWLSELRFLGYNCCLIDWDLYYVYACALIILCLFFYYVLSDVGAPYSVCSAVVVMSVVKALSVCVCVHVFNTLLVKAETCCEHRVHDTCCERRFVLWFDLSALFPAAIPTLAEFLSGQQRLFWGRIWVYIYIYMYVSIL